MRFIKSFLIAAVIGVAAAEHDPAEELASFQIADGFEVSLFASETDGLIKPIQMRFDARGRLWVIGSAVYPQLEPGQKPNDKVLILEDRDHDGRVDSVKTFADGLMIPTGLELTRDGAYVGHGTELLLLRDTDGDDRADERIVVLRGFGTGDNHQNINSFTWSPSGELWMCQGLHILSRVETINGLVELNKAGIWRYRPRVQKLEGFYGSEHEPQNPWGHVFNEWNEHIVLAGNNSSPIFPDPGLVPNRRDDAPPLIWPDGKGRKVSGGDFVSNAHWPDDWQGRLILGGYINNAVWSVNVIDDGAGFRFEDAPPLIRSTRREFRPVDVKFGPDGALYLCDWYNPIIGHYQASFRHPDRDKTHGRIWRVTAKNRALTAQPKIADASVDELLALLASKDRWTGQNTIRELSQRSPKDISAPLVKWASDSARSEQELMHAIGILQAHEQPKPNLLVRLAKASDPRARAYAGYILGLSRGSVETLKMLANDANPRVRLEAIIAAAQVNNREAVDVLVAAAGKPFDRFLTYAFNQAVHSLKPHWKPLSIPLDRPEVVAAFVRADGTADTLDALRKVQNSQPGLLAILAEVGTPEDLASILKRGEAQLGSMPLRAMAHRTIKPSGDVAALLNPYFDSRLIHDALALAGNWKVEPLLPKIRELARAKENTVAIQTLAKFGATELPLIREIATNGSAKAKAVALAQWQIFEPRAAAQRAAEFLATEAGAEDCMNLIAGFLTRPSGVAELAKAVDGKNIPEDVRKAAVTLINASGRQEELARAFSGIPNRKAVVDEAFVMAVRNEGDAQRGAQIYNRGELGCALCHKVNGKGGAVGPELSALGTAQPIDFIARAILEPQKEIKEGFTSVLIALKNGEEFQGYVTRENNEEIVLRQPLLNDEVRLRKPEIASNRSNGSLMPSGLADHLTPDEFRDLVKYLSTLGKP
ncbi:MAG TPA: PVC-type heme-binding CxxCH protein [Verrucomicrobiae bacterium]|nr:PVC-type heme-binding CxxCH protein [Verrucomicrobiae bacterium]